MVKKKIKIILFILIFSGSVCFSQSSVGYSYDNNGNRVGRIFIGMIIKPNFPPKDTTGNSKQLQDEQKTALQNGLSVYPNPTQNAVTVSINAPTLKQQDLDNTTVYLTDNMGRVLSQKKYVSGENFDLSPYLPGNYYLRVSFNNKEEVYYKVVKVN